MSECGEPTRSATLSTGQPKLGKAEEKEKSSQLQQVLKYQRAIQKVF